MSNTSEFRSLYSVWKSQNDGASKCEKFADTCRFDTERKNNRQMDGQNDDSICIALQLRRTVKIIKHEKYEQELIRRWDSERELFYNIAHVEASAYAHWTSS